MRRSDREVSGLDNILAIFNKCEALHLGLCLDNKPYIVPMNFAYEVVDGQVFIFLHCASEGKKLDIISKNDNVCFEAYCSYKTLPDEKACNWSAEFQSVMGEGRISTVTKDDKKAAAFDLIMKRHGFEGPPQISPRMLAKVTVLQIEVTSITGKSSIKNS